MKRVTAVAFPANPHLESACDLGKAMRAARTQAGLRIQDAALALGMATQTLTDIESGKPTVSLGKVLDAARGLGVDLFALPRRKRDAALQRLADLK